MVVGRRRRGRGGGRRRGGRGAGARPRTRIKFEGSRPGASARRPTSRVFLACGRRHDSLLLAEGQAAPTLLCVVSMRRPRQKCNMARQAVEGRSKDVGRPLGLLLTWLQDGANHENDRQHKDNCFFAHEDRLEVREHYERNDISTMSKYFRAVLERPQRIGEPKEPLRQP